MHQKEVEPKLVPILWGSNFTAVVNIGKGGVRVTFFETRDWDIYTLKTEWLAAN